MARKHLGNTLSRPCRAARRVLGSPCGTCLLRRARQRGSWPPSVVPLQDRRVLESESVRAVIKRVCRDHWWLPRPHTLTGPTYQQTYPRRVVPRAAAACGGTILTNKPLTCTCRDLTGSWCATLLSADLTFSDLTLSLPPMGNWGIPVYDHNGLRGETKWTWGGGGKNKPPSRVHPASKLSQWSDAIST
jgi:hypothetical protein